MKIKAEDCQNLERALKLEWLETNGRGGFASGTVAGPNTRRYHALLLVARKLLAERCVLVNHLEERLDINGSSFPLSTNLYPGTVHPDGYRRCVGFASEPWPTWTYALGGVTVAREIFNPRGRELVVVRWRLAEPSTRSARLVIRPMLTGRGYHSLHHENGSIRTDATARDGLVAWQPYGDLPQVRAIHTGEYRHQPDWFRRVQYPVEQERGLEYEEDWWSPGEVAFTLSHEKPASLVFTTELVDPINVDALAKGEQRRRKAVRTGVPKGDPLARSLWSASEAYISERGKQHTVIAGYPWFTDWGRDTFLSLPGLCLVTGRYDVARQVIEAFAAHVSRGMIPNRFPDAGEMPEYNTIDGSLWFIHAVGRYLDHTGDDRTVEQVGWPAVRQILDGYRQGTRYGIKVDHDGLVTSGAPGVQLTWMDAKVGEWVVSPRRGKPVEIQALWIRALGFGEILGTRFGDPAFAARCRADRVCAIKSFRARFWHEAGGYLYDLIDGEHGDDASLRPNQIFAVALTKGLLNRDQAKRVVQVVEEQLLTPVGLRTLAPGDPRYRPRYEGSVADRDGAYHQGTVWPFLLGPFVTAWVSTHGGTTTARRKAREFFKGIERHLAEACLGQVSEIFDAEAPHTPRGCFAQAWSVAEVLRALVEDVLGQEPRKPLPRAGKRQVRRRNRRI